MVGKGSLNHNSREFYASNVDPNRSHLNIEFCCEDIRNVYHELFDEAQERFNAKQTRNDRRIEDYYEKICSSKQEKPFHEIVLQIGNKDDTGIHEWRNKKHDETKEDITDDVVFEVELIRQVEINIDYILMLVKKYHDTHCDDKEVLITIRKAIDASPELRSKKQLIETFIAGVNDVDDVMAKWNTYVSEQREKELAKIIQEEKLKEPETRKYLANAFRDGEIKTVGTDIDKLMPPVSRFGGGGRAQKKQGVIDKLKNFFDKFFGIGNFT